MGSGLGFFSPHQVSLEWNSIPGWKSHFLKPARRVSIAGQQIVKKSAVNIIGLQHFHLGGSW